MLKIALRSLFGHKLRLIITTVAVVLGVGFMAATFVLTDTLGATFDQLFEDVNEGTDALIRQQAAFDGSNPNQGTGAVRGDLDPALLETVRAAPGVADADLVVFSIATVAGLDGEPVNENPQAPQFGFNWSDVEQFNPYDIDQGKAPEGPNEVMIDRGTAKKGDLGVGDRVKIQSLTAPFEAEISGIVTFGGQDTSAGASVVLMDTAASLQRFTPNGMVQSLVASAEPGVSQEQLVQNLTTVLPEGVEAITGEASTAEQQDQLQSGLRIFNTVLGGFALVALLAGTFLIYNTFGIIVAQRTRELALLRALGAGRAQVRRSVIAEAAAIGLMASILGLLAGIVLAVGLTALFGAIGIDLPSTGLVIALRTVIVSIVIGLLTTTLSALIPAWRASRVTPMEAMRESAVETPRPSWVRIAVGVAFLTLGAALLTAGSIVNNLWLVAGGGLVAFIAVFLLGPVLAGVITGTLGRAAPGMTGRLARENMVRNPKRSSNTAASLILGLGVVTVFTIFATSFGASINAAVEEGFVADFQVAAGGFGVGGISPEFAKQIRELPGVDAVTGLRRGSALVVEPDGSESRAIFGVHGRDLERLLDLGLQEGSFDDLGPETIAVDRDTVDENGWKLGDELLLTYADRTVHPHRIVAIYENGGVVAQQNDGHFLVDMSVYDASQPVASQVDNRVLVRAAPGTNLDRLRKDLERASADYGSPKVQDLGEVQKEQTRQINQQLGFLVILLAISIIIGFIGIFNTLALSVFERTREIGLLRAVGMARGQVAVMVLTESVLVSMLGSVLGFALGLGIGSSLMLAISNELPTARISVPIPVLVIYGMVAVVGGTAAGVFPAFRAARLNVLEAIGFE